MKRVFFLHGWGGHADEGWRPWLEKEFEQRAFTVHNLEMPNTHTPQVEEWVTYLKNIVKIPDEQCYFIGHSLGCITILRFLETLDEYDRVGGCIFVAGFAEDIGIAEIRNFFRKPINWQEIKKHCKKFIAIHSDNDPYVDLKFADIFVEKLKAHKIIMQNMKHFSGDDGIIELPIVLKSLLEVSNIHS